MRKLIYHVAASLDSFIAHPDGSVDGFLLDGDFVVDFVEAIKSYGAVLMGRKTYEAGYTFGLQPGETAYTHLNPELANYIFSNTLSMESNDRIELVRQLKAQPGRPIWLCGGGELAGELLAAQLINELVVKCNPILLGSGIRLFGTAEHKVGLHLLESKAYAFGLVRMSYSINYSVV
jgi:dihydrofolate reductase